MLSPPSTGKKRKRPNAAAELDAARKKIAELESALAKVRGSLTEAPKIGQQLLWLFVGPEPQFMTLHTNLIQCSTRNFLYQLPTRLNGLIHVVDADPELAALWRLFLYTGKIWSRWEGDIDDFDDGLEEVHGDREWHRLMSLYFLARLLRDESFGNKIIDGLFEKVEESHRYPTDLATKVWHATASEDALRKVIVDLHVWKGQGNGILAPHADRDGPRDFLERTRSALRITGGRVKDARTIVPWALASSRCAKYHSHQLTEHCGIEVVDLTEAGNAYEYSRVSVAALGTPTQLRGSAVHYLTP